MKTYNNQHNLVINNPTDSLDFNNCSNITINKPKIQAKGTNNICMTNCSDCHIIGGSLSSPKKAVNDPDDPENHNLLFNGCDNCSVFGTTCGGKEPRGDAINLFNCSNCLVQNCVVNGPLALKGTACILDGGKCNSNVIDNLTINSPDGRVVICGGKNNVFKNTKVLGAVEITGEYYKKAVVKDLVIECVSGPEVYINKKTVSGLKMKNCSFSVVNNG